MTTYLLTDWTDATTTDDYADVELNLNPRGLYLFGVPPKAWWTRWMCSIMGSDTFHWGLLIKPDKGDYITSESQGKGTTISRLDGRQVRFYRVKGVRVNTSKLISIHSEYGELPYSWDTNLRTAIWFIAKHYFHKILPVVKDTDDVNCVSWVCLVANELGVKLIPDDEYATPAALENSNRLEYIGETD